VLSVHVLQRRSDHPNRDETLSDLDKLALQYGTDKGSHHHNYVETYESLFEDIRPSVKSLIEIGAGGVSYKGERCASLQMWRDWFPDAVVVGVDNDPTVQGDNGPRIQIAIGDQTSKSTLDLAVSMAGGSPNIIIDDGSHINRLSIATFEYLWPHLADGGIYVIEDTQCTYTMPVFGNDRVEFDRFLLNLIRCVDVNGRKVTDRDIADLNKMGDFALNTYESTVQSVLAVRGMVAVTKRQRPLSPGNTEVAAAG